MSEFEKALKGHDWYYAYSDDHAIGPGELVRLGL